MKCKVQELKINLNFRIENEEVIKMLVVGFLINMISSTYLIINSY